MSAIVILIIKLTEYSEHKEFLSLDVGDILQQYETISYANCFSGNDDIVQDIGNPRKIVNVSDDIEDNRVIILDDGSQLTWDRYQDYEFKIIKKDSK